MTQADFTRYPIIVDIIVNAADWDRDPACPPIGELGDLVVTTLRNGPSLAPLGPTMSGVELADVDHGRTTPEGWTSHALFMNVFVSVSAWVRHWGDRPVRFLPARITADLSAAPALLAARATVLVAPVRKYLRTDDGSLVTED